MSDTPHVFHDRPAVELANGLSLDGALKELRRRLERGGVLADLRRRQRWGEVTALR